MPTRDRMIMMKRVTPKRVTLPNSRTFVARYDRVTCDQLHANIRLSQPYKQRTAPRSRCRVQWGWGIGSNILKLAKKVFKSPIVRELCKMTLNELPNLYSKDSNKIKNKKVRKILQSDLANTLVDMGADAVDRN